MWICRKRTPIDTVVSVNFSRLLHTLGFFLLPSFFLLSLLECPPASVHRSGAAHLKTPLPSALSLVSFTPLYDWTKEKPVQAVVTVKRVIDAAVSSNHSASFLPRNMSRNIQSRDSSSCVSYEPVITLMQRRSKVSICVLCVCAELK